jgi:phosphatidylinositol dimannoside acyltransferase
LEELRLKWSKSIVDPAMERDFANQPGKFAVESIFWRQAIDWSVDHIPAIFHRPLIWIAAFAFFFVAAPARKALLRNLRLIHPRSWGIANYFRVVRVFANFGWSLADAASYRLSRARFRYEVEGARFIEQLTASKGGGIVLTAHMGNYNLGAAFFTERFHRRIRMVRAPEPDVLAAQHVDLGLRESTAGAVSIGYSDDGTSLAFDLLNELRAGEIISVQGDRVVGEVACAPVKFFGHELFLPNGPFVLSLVSETPVYPLFVVRTGYRKYRIIAREPIACARTGPTRDQIIAEAMQRWAAVLENVVRTYWPQWFAFTALI